MDINTLMQNLNEVVSSAKNGEQTARRVSNELTAVASTLRKLSDQLVMLSCQLVGNDSTEPVGKRTVIIKDEAEAKAYKKSKSKRAGKRRGSSGWTPERRAAQRERMLRLQAELAETRAKKALLNTAIVTQD